MQSRVAVSAVSAAFLMSIAGAGSGAEKRRLHDLQPLGEIPRARQVEVHVPPRAELRVGERRSFQGVTAAGTPHRSIVEVQAIGGVLTVHGMGEGTGEIAFLGAAGPGKLIVTVRKAEP